MEIFEDGVKDFINKLNGIDERKINRAILKIKNSKFNQKEYLELLVKKVASFLNENKNDSDRDLFIQKFKLALSLGDFKFSKEEVDELFKRYFSNEVTVSNIVKNVKAENNSSNDFSSKLNLSDIQNLKYDSLILSKINADLAVLRKYRNDMSYKRDKKYSKNDIPNEVKALLSDNVSGNGMKEVNDKISELENYQKNILNNNRFKDNDASAFYNINKFDISGYISEKDHSVIENDDNLRREYLIKYGFENLIAEINDRLYVLENFYKKSQYSGKNLIELNGLLNDLKQLVEQNVFELNGLNIQDEIKKIISEINMWKYGYENFSVDQINYEIQRLNYEKQKYIDLNGRNNLDTYSMITDSNLGGNNGTISSGVDDFGSYLTYELLEEKVKNENNSSSELNLSDIQKLKYDSLNFDEEAEIIRKTSLEKLKQDLKDFENITEFKSTFGSANVDKIIDLIKEEIKNREGALKDTINVVSSIADVPLVENKTLTNIEDLKNEIDKLDAFSDVAIHLKINEILKIKSDEDKDILFDFLVEKVSKLIKKLDDEEQRTKANILKNLLSKYATLSDSKIGELFTKHGLDFGEKDNVKSENIVVEEREIDKIENRIGELAMYFAKVPDYDVDLVKYIDKLKNDNRELDLEKSKAIKEVNGEIEALNLKFNQGNNIQLSDEERVIVDKYKHLTDEELLVELNKFNVNIDGEISKIEEELASLNQNSENTLSSRTSEEIEEELESKKKERDEYQKELEAKGVSYTDWYMDEKLNKLNDEVNTLEDALKNSQSRQSYNNFNYIVDNKRVELKKLFEEKEQKNIEINKEINRRRNSSSNGLIDNEDYRLALEALEKKKKQIQSGCDTKTAENQKNIDKAEELKGLREIRDAYLTIENDAIKNFENYDLNEKDPSVDVKDFVDNHELISKLDNYPDASKLRQELIEDVCNNLKSKKVEKVEKNNKLALKVLSGAAGFVAGWALHTNPVLGVIFGARAMVGGAKFVTKMFPNSKVTRVINGISEKIKETGNKFKEKCPKIASAVAKVKKVLKNDYVQWALNGFTVGYIAGNLFDAFKPENKPTPENKVEKPSDFDPVPEEVGLLTEQINIGDILDVSEIKEGFISSTSDKPVSLMTNLGKSVRVDQIVNGRVHVTSMIDNERYAWISKDAIKEVLKKFAKVAGRLR